MLHSNRIWERRRPGQCHLLFAEDEVLGVRQLAVAFIFLAFQRRPFRRVFVKNKWHWASSPALPGDQRRILTMQIEKSILELARRIREASGITLLTGAGISAASGVPTFRGTEGLWKSYSPQELATPEAFQNDPGLVWEWYDWRRGLISKCNPNTAHHVLALWSKRYSGFTLITQNVDGLHEKAGTENIIRFHGSIWEVFCWNRCPSSPARWINNTVPLPEIPPSCPYCGGLIRPGVVWFGEGIDGDVLARSAASLDCDVFMTVGTSAQVYPAAGLVSEARRRGAFAAEINLEATPASRSVDLSIQGPAEVVLQKVEDLLQEKL
jgi:NAD-dependent deacetylase